MAAKKRRKRRVNKVRRQSRKSAEPESSIEFGIIGGADPRLKLQAGGENDGPPAEITIRLFDVHAARHALDAFESVCGDDSGAPKARRGRRAKRSDAGQPRGRRAATPAVPADEDEDAVDVTARKKKTKKKKTKRNADSDDE